MQKFALAVSILAISSVSALAADMAPRYTKAPAMVASPAYSWTGFYAGVNIGYGVAADPSTLDAFVNPVIGFDNLESYKISPAGFLGGAQIGYNADEDRRRHTVSDGGIVVVTKEDEPFLGPIAESALRDEAQFDARGSG